MSIESGRNPAEAEVNREQSPDFSSVLNIVESNIETAIEAAEGRENSEDGPGSNAIENLQKSLEEKKEYAEKKVKSHETYNDFAMSRVSGEPGEKAADYAMLVALTIDRAERIKNGGETDDDEFYTGVTSADQITGGNVTVDTSVMAQADKHQIELIGKALGVDLSKEIDSDDPRLEAIWRNVGDLPKSRIWGDQKENFSSTDEIIKSQKERVDQGQISFHETNIPNFILRKERNNVWGHYQFPDRMKQLEEQKESDAVLI